MYWIAFIFAFLLIIAKPSRYSVFRGREYVWKYAIYFSTFVAIFLYSVITSYSAAEELSFIIFGGGHVMEKLESGVSENEALKAGIEAGFKDGVISRIELTELARELGIDITADLIDNETARYVIDYIVNYRAQEIIKNRVN